ncbi:hypothetical protein GPECTOR_471g391 [Gonium pectorale]|uniref:Uncharacterized protein n=1 Tax=Gonium pectorale TaxID=33097 RepID=A0A150FUZ5_GONPE|nr:hypothetical protein GPECTOR_471g391 [Gonium pectorale]|eukprot:KXZ41432.1 hypothetical protein GPECTOR_471g391 [Gonium pectorale]
MYGIRPYVTWGNVPGPLANVMSDNGCNPKICTYLVAKFGPVTSSNWGKLPADWQQTWIQGSCDSVVKTQCPAVVGYLPTPNEDHNGDDIANGGSTVWATCTGNKGCWGYNSNGWMKTSGVVTNAASGVCFRTKLSSV